MNELDTAIKATAAAEVAAWNEYKAFIESPAFKAMEEEKNRLTQIWHPLSRKLEALKLLKGDTHETK